VYISVVGWCFVFAFWSSFCFMFQIYGWSHGVHGKVTEARRWVCWWVMVQASIEFVLTLSLMICLMWQLSDALQMRLGPRQSRKKGRNRRGGGQCGRCGCCGQVLTEFVLTLSLMICFMWKLSDALQKRLEPKTKVEDVPKVKRMLLIVIAKS
jgi:Na+-transporting methylmalonyl-CoA/oxaloacetate decarboxylase gamma subunit